MKIHLSERQQNTVATAVTLFSLVVIVSILLVAFVLLARFCAYFSGVFLPLAVAFILAVMLKPFYELLHLRLHWKPALAVLGVFVSFILPLALVSFFFGSLIVSQCADLISNAPEALRRLRESVHGHWPQIEAFWAQHGVTERLQEFVQTRSDVLAATLQNVMLSAVDVGTGAFKYITGLFNWFVMPVYLVFMLLAPPYDVSRMGGGLTFLKTETRKDVYYLVNEFVQIVVTFFRGQILIALAQGLLMGIGFALVGLKYGFVLGLLLGFLNIIPYLGSMIGIAITLPLAFFQADGGMMTLGLVVLVMAIVSAIEGYVLTPRIMGKSTGLHPMTIMVALFFWGTAFGGIMGMILAIPLTAFLVVFWRLAREKYLAREVL